jgi:malonate transporter
VTAAVGSIVVSLAATFVVMIAGWALRRWFRFGDAFLAEVERLAYWVLLPALLMIGLARFDFGAVPAVSMIVVLACSCAAAGLLALAVRRLVAGDNGPAFTSVVQGTVRFNNYIGLTLATGLYGAAGLSLAALATAVLVPVGNVIAALSLARYGAPGQHTPHPLLAMITNPLVLGCLGGLGSTFLAPPRPP